MSVRQKSMVLLAVALTLGILLGISGSSVLQDRKAERQRSVREAGGLMHLIERVIEIDSDAQRQQIREVVEASEAQLDDVRRSCGALFGAHRDSLVTKLTAVITPSQQEALEQWANREREKQHSRERSSSKKRSKHSKD